MSILIKGMEMPKNCRDCEITKGNYYCPFTGISWMQRNETYYNITHPRCPAIEIQPHGRLIDADAFDERVRIAGGMVDEELTDDFKDGIQTTLFMLKTQRTIIEAEEADG